MAQFPSDEWVKEYMEKLNASKSYEDAGKTWEGDILFVVQKDENHPTDEYIYLDLFHGKCRSAKYINTADNLPKTEFKYIGKYSNWVKLLKKEIDPIHGIITGKFKLDGSPMKIMRYTKAAKEMVNTASLVESDI